MIYHYYRVKAGDTLVHPVYLLCWPVLHPAGTNYRLLPEDERFAVYPDLVTALEKAKAGALAYIGRLISSGKAGLPELLQYRIDHYEDLNVNLTEANIRRIEQRVSADPQFHWQPYRIHIPYDH
ncbi:hypothetical protein AAFN85_03110 [Mucilaginibacter sp. CAU 1740]|uniref:hypothetical protein n=1 Tax=Mucilaginibacter sp. CAU 1740 TaxID=3140365 RepID=UPI00325C048D